MAAGGPSSFVATKVTKKAFSRKASLPHGAFALQIRQNHGLQTIAPKPHIPYAAAKFAMPFRPTGHHCFACFRPKLFC